MSAMLAATEAVTDLYSAHHGWLHRWLRQKLGNAAEAADLAHDTFLRILGRGEVPDLREPRAYLVTIAGGLVANHWRRQALEQAYLDALAAQPEPLAPSPETLSQIVEALAEVARLLEGLPPRVREIFLLSQLDGLTYPCIAERLGVTVNVVQKAMIRAVTHCHRAAALMPE